MSPGRQSRKPSGPKPAANPLDQLQTPAKARKSGKQTSGGIILSQQELAVLSILGHNAFPLRQLNREFVFRPLPIRTRESDRKIKRGSLENTRANFEPEESDDSDFIKLDPEEGLPESLSAWEERLGIKLPGKLEMRDILGRLDSKGLIRFFCPFSPDELWRIKSNWLCALNEQGFDLLNKTGSQAAPAAIANWNQLLARIHNPDGQRELRNILNSQFSDGVKIAKFHTGEYDLRQLGQHSHLVSKFLRRFFLFNGNSAQGRNIIGGFCGRNEHGLTSGWLALCLNFNPQTVPNQHKHMPFDKNLSWEEDSEINID